MSLDRRSHINDTITAAARVSSFLAVVRFINFTVCDSFICDCKERCLEVLVSVVTSGANCAKEQRKSFMSEQLANLSSVRHTVCYTELCLTDDMCLPTHTCVSVFTLCVLRLDYIAQRCISI